MLVRLYQLPCVGDLVGNLKEQGITVRPARPYETHIVAAWVGQHFSPKWVSECRVAMSHQPVGCFIATRDKKVIGFACCDATARGFIGPMGVNEECRGTGVGKALLVTALEALKAQGYAYGIIGGVGPADFYAKTVGATPIENSSPGIYEDLLPG
ncbi:MAG: GNAT family N-acetyltransferase [Akkermansia sp.]